MADIPVSKVSVTQTEGEKTPPYIPDAKEQEAKQDVMKAWIDGRQNVYKSYAQFNDRNLYDTIDDWTKRWNGYVPPADALIDPDQSRMFLNFTRNQIVSYLAKVALQRPQAHIKAVRNKTGLPDVALQEVLEDLNNYSLDKENGEARFMEACLEVVTKGTVIVYEGYRKETQEYKDIEEFDAQTGEIKYGPKKERIIYDDCFQQVVPLEDFFVANVYQPDMQKQPWVIWRQITSYDEAWRTFSKYPNWKYVKSGAWNLEADPSTFYRNKIITDLNKNQVEVIRYYNRKKNQHRIMVNGIILYDGPIPFKDGRYPFAKGIFEPFEVNFFWGMGYPQKIMGEQDLMNTMWNMMADKTFGSLLPFGLSSDLDDLIEDDILQPNKIRKVTNVNNWKIDSLPGVTQGEESMLQQALAFARENGGDMTGAVNAFTPKGGKLTARQALLKQQEAMQRLGFSMNYMEDFEVDRTTLRINHILQFYTLPKIERIAGKDGKEVEQLLYRDFRNDNVKLSNGKMGTRVIKMVGGLKNPDARRKLADEMSVQEIHGDIAGTPTQVIALDVDSIYDYNYSVVVVPNSSYHQNQVLEQSQRMEYATWRTNMAQIGYPTDIKSLGDWVGEAFDVDASKFEPKGGMGGMGGPSPEGGGGPPMPKANGTTPNRIMANNQAKSSDLFT